MLLHFLPAICASFLGAVGCQQDQPTGVRAARPQADVAQTHDTTLAPVADTYIRQGSPNQNQGAELILQLQSSGKNRALLRWDQQALVQALGGGAVSAARLELTIADLGDNWSTTGRTIELHRMTQAWTELGATWNCAVDSAPGNSRAACAGATAWDMDHSASYPWVPAPTAIALLKNGQTGVVTFDVTADVVAWLAGQPNDGWILKKTVEGDPGKVDFGSRESATAPGLLVSVAVADTSRPPIPTSTAYPRDTLYVVTNPADTGRIYYRRLYEIMFADSASGSSFRALLAKYHAQIVDGVPITRSYIVMMPDPGATWQAVQARRDSLHREPIVVVFMPLIRRDSPPVLHSRFPADGVGHARSDWFDGSLSTWAHRAIDAPLAWGCETGTYAAFRPRVGVLEWRFDTTIADLKASTPVLTMSASKGNAVETTTVRIFNERHGSAVAATLSAAGDNGLGIAGMVWRSDLRYYALGALDLSDPDSYSLAFRKDLLPRIIADQPAVLSVSSSFGGSPADSDETRSMVTATMRLFRESPRTLVVVAAGNAGTNTTIDDLLKAHGTQLGFDAALARIARDSGFADRILYVGGTMPGNQRWTSDTGGSDFIPGLVGIAAPAQNVPTIWGGAEALGTGTSLAAPLVAGAVLQLVSADSTLAPAQARSYLQRGASEPYEDYPGHLVYPSPVSGFDGSIFQLNAYRSLRLLSSERPGTPICGFPVSVSLDDRSVVLERPGHPETFTLPTDTSSISKLSVAQGGRLISAFMLYGSFGQGYSTVIDQHGQVLATVPNSQRIFLERDILDAPSPWLLGTDPVYTLRRGGGGTALEVRPWSRLPSPERDAWGLVAFSPSGDQLALLLQMASTTELWMMPTDSGAPPRQPWTSTGLDGPGPLDLQWSHDSRRLIGLTGGWAGDGTFAFRIAGVGDDGVAHDLVVPPGWEWNAYTFTADDSAVVSVEPQPPGWWQCNEVRRDPATWAATSIPRPVGDCTLVPLRIFPTAPPARPMLEARSAAVATGFDLAQPARALARGGQASWRGASGGRRVQVN